MKFLIHSIFRKLRSYFFKAHYLLLLSLIFVSCNTIPEQVKTVLESSGENKVKLGKVIEHYKNMGDDQKLKAAYFLIENIPDQFHYAGRGVDEYRKVFNTMDSIISARGEIDYNQVWDSLQPDENSRIKKVYDVDVITSEFLIKNIDDAFTAWNYPWAKDLSFEEFCEYILPYKLKNETPEDWRGFFQKKYQWVLDSLKDKSNAREACILINNDLMRWFYITKLKCPFDLAFNDLIKLKSGRCAESTQLTAYAMRAMGLPVTLDYVSLWANRSGAHDWNALIYKNRMVPFLGTEVNPGVYKIEFAMPGSIKSKMAKVFRRTFTKSNNIAPAKKDWDEIPKIFKDTRFLDVTKEYIPTSTIVLESDKKLAHAHIVYLSIFNRYGWYPIEWSYADETNVAFKDLGNDIVYLPTVFEEGNNTPIDLPFVISKSGNVTYIKAAPDKKINITIDRKYPVGDDNKIVVGNNYELVYWDNKWVSLGKQTAKEDILTFNNVPDGALLWLKNLDEGFQERIFTIKNGKIIWW